MTPSLGGCETSRNSFSFFTVLSYWGVAFYFLVAAVHTFFYARYRRTPLESWGRPLQALHALFYSTIITYPFLVVIVFWGLLSAPDTLSTTYSAWSNISEHALNSAFAFLEVVLPRTDPSPWIHLPFLLILVALYLALAYITHATKGFYTYTFLDPGLQGPLVAAYVFGIAIGICLLFVIIKALVWLRRWVTEEKLGMDGVFAHGGGHAARVDEERAHRGHADADKSAVDSGHELVEMR